MKRKKIDLTKCVICKTVLAVPAQLNTLPLCSKLECGKEVAKIFGSFVKAIDEEAEIDSEGFMLDGKLVRYGHEDEDIENILSVSGKETK